MHAPSTEINSVIDIYTLYVQAYVVGAKEISLRLSGIAGVVSWHTFTRTTCTHLFFLAAGVAIAKSNIFSGTYYSFEYRASLHRRQKSVSYDKN